MHADNINSSAQTLGLCGGIDMAASMILLGSPIPGIKDLEMEA
jgi:hypothetical protein